MKFLIDTNILLPLEPGSLQDIGPQSRVAAEFLSNVAKSKSSIYVHPAMLDDIKRDKNEDRKLLRLKLFKKYQSLADTPPHLTVLAVFENPQERKNDWVDACLLTSIQANAIDYLVTEDNDIHKRARRLSLDTRVLYLDEAAAFVRTLFDLSPTPPPAVEKILAYQLNRDDKIFESLRKDYGDTFNPWLEKCAKEHRDCWTIRDTARGEYAGIAIVKKEMNPGFGLTGEGLKICTFKISDQSTRQRYGELLLKSIFDYAHQNSFPWLYLTAFPKQEVLIDFLTNFGFERSSKQNERNEFILIKSRKPDVAAAHQKELEYHIKYGPPTLSPVEHDVFIVPILPEYHKMLFPDAELQTDLFPGLISCGNGIRKAYLCHSNVKKIPQGALLCFYRSKDARNIRVIGIVESSSRSNRAEEIAMFVGTRTVYNMQEIERMAKKEVLTILFRQVNIIPAPIAYRDLREQSALTGPPQSILKVAKEPARWLNQIIKRQC